MSRSLYRLGRFAARRPWTVIGVWLALAVAVMGASGPLGADLEDGFAVPGTDSERATALLTDAGSDRRGLTAQIVAAPLAEGVSLADSASGRAALDTLGRELTRLPNVLDVSDPALSPDGRVALIRLQYPEQEALRAADLENLKEAVERAREGAPLRIEMGGDLFFAFEEAETGTGEMIGVLVAVVILLVAFGSLIAMGLPIGLALFGLALGISAMPLVAHIVEIPSWAPQMAAMVGIGVGIDYALFMVVRHREFLAEGHDVAEAAGRASATAGRAVVFAGGIVVVSILGLAVAGVPFLTAAGVATSLVVLIMVVASTTLLPAFLGLAGPWINRLSTRRRERPARMVWERWGRHVARHAAGYALAGVATLALLAAPALTLDVGFFDDGTLPDERTERRAYDLVAEGFGPGANGPLVIAVDPAGQDGVVPLLSAAIAADPGIASVAPPDRVSGRDVIVLTAVATSEPHERETVETIARLRAEVLPEVLAGGPATAHIGGQTASFSDVSGRVSDRLALFIIAVVAVAFILLTIVVRSVLVPLKAAALNLLSIGAAYGVLVMVFQWGWGNELIGLESTVPILSFIPLFMFAVVFGLSMDYEVFLLSRIREAYAATGDNVGAVVAGIAGTARVITSAALIMVAVFLGFVLGSDPAVKMVGVGLATAILVDATIVRLVLVPATMTLLGDANWWLPRWLERVLPARRPQSEAERTGSAAAEVV